MHDYHSLALAARQARAGDTIVLEPGRYVLTDKVRAYTPGRAHAPITVTSSRFGRAVLEVHAQSGFHLDAPHWRIEALLIEGKCANHSTCEHAFHIQGRGDDVVIRGNRVTDFNAHLKANGTIVDGDRKFPDRVLIEGNVFTNRTVRQTSNPVTPIDVVGGRQWVVRDNLIEDFAKAAGNRVSYGVYLKGNSSHGLIERNLVRCQRAHRGHARIGISLGGGGTGQRYCAEGDCRTEHRGGTIRNNVVLDCPGEHGIYLFRAADSRIIHNSVTGTRGILVRGRASSAVVVNNLVGGEIRASRGGKIERSAGNLAVANTRVLAWLHNDSGWQLVPRPTSPPVDPRTEHRWVEDDYCARPRRDGRPDVGALEYGRQGWCSKFLSTGEP